MTERIQTGSKGLDTILRGGFLRHNSVLLKGAPGTGKTSLGIQILLEGIREHDEGAIICSFEQFPQQLHRDTRAFGWNLQELVDSGKLAILFVTPEDLITPAGSENRPFISRVFEVAEGVGARRLLLDSLSHFGRIALDPQACRKILMDFVNDVKSIGLTPILTAELESRSSMREFSFEEYLVDEVVLLHNELSGSTAAIPRRTLEVTKSRGHGHEPGRHPFQFAETGIEVYPHVLPEPFAPDELAELDMTQMTTGVAGADKLTGGGIPRGSSTMVAGVSGTYKTTLACSFLAECLEQKQKGLLLTFQENPSQLRAMMAARDVPLDAACREGAVEIRHYVSRRSDLDKIFAELMERIEEGPLDRVVIDSVDDFERSIDDPNAWQDYLGMFLAALRRAGVTTMLTQRLTHVSSSNPLVDIRYTADVDGVVYLGAVEIESEIHRVVSVLKSRGADAENDLREIVCGENGLEVSHKFHGLTGILQGNAQGQFKRSVENIFQPLYFVRDFAKMGTGDKATDDQRKKVLHDILSQVESLDVALQDYFGFDPEQAKKR